MPKPKKKFFTTAYLEYMQSAAWRALRYEVICEAGHNCSECPETRFLHVHHKTYKRFGHELKEDLEVLCQACHKKRHPHMDNERDYVIVVREKWGENRVRKPKVPKHLRAPRIRKKPRKPRYASPEERLIHLAERTVRREARRAARRATVYSVYSSETRMAG